jgi:RecA/RadA recombinase
MTASLPLAVALQSLEARWGAAAPRSAGRRTAGEVVAGHEATVWEGISADGPGAVIGALATVPLPLEQPVTPPSSPPVVRTGFAALDAILGPGGLPRAGSVAVRGDGSSGTTTLALRLLAEAQAAGGIVGYVDLARSFDPIEAVARGIHLEWLVLLTPASLDEGLSMTGALLRARTVDVLVLDLPARGSHLRSDGRGRPDGRSRSPRSSPGVGERLRRLAALARNAEALLVVIEPPGLPRSLGGALEETAGVRLELARRAWIRLGRDVVGQRTEVVVARNRSGPPGRRAELRILYADGGDRDACLHHEGLLHERPSVIPPPVPPPGPTHLDRTLDRIPFPSRALTFDATPSSPLASPPAPIGTVAAGRDRDRAHAALRLIPGASDRPGRTALERRGGPRCQPRGPGARGSTRVGAGERTPPGS